MTRTELAELLAPTFDAFREQVLDLVHAEVSTLVDGAREVALRAFEKAFMTSPAKAAPSPRRPSLSRPPATSPSSSGRKPSTCSKCGLVGFTARTCGKTHNVSTAPATSTERSPRTRATSPDARADTGGPHSPAPSILTSSPPPHSATRPRYSAAEIEAAKKRIAERRAREAQREAERAAFPRVDTRVGPQGGGARGERAVPSVQVSALPAPLSTFKV